MTKEELKSIDVSKYTVTESGNVIKDTKDKLKQEAEDYAREWLFHVKDLELYHKEDDKPKYIRIKEAYLAGAEPREKRIAELEAQIEKMKWHYLVENPKDLPKKEGPYWVCVRDGKYKEDGSWEWTSKPLCRTAVWLDGIFGKAGGPPVIAWCELPKWEIKEK